MKDLQAKPLDRWEGEYTKTRRDAPFRASWSNTVDLLDREAWFLKSKDFTLLMAVDSDDIRNDGWIRASARPRHPGIVVLMATRHGHMRYQCDRYKDWQDNVRAIALTLERLRKAELYGVIQSGQQYLGFKALPAPDGMAPNSLAENGDTFTGNFHAAQFLASVTKSKPDEILSSSKTYRATRKMAAIKLHPDRGGTSEQFKKFQKACELLDSLHNC